MTRLEVILKRGYFPKELPPAFYTNRFAKYACSKGGRAVLTAYKPADNFTECVKYLLALPGGHRRELRIPHPASYTDIAILIAENLKRIISIAGKSSFAVSKPHFTPKGRRAFRPDISPSDLATERAARRAGATHLLKADVSQFYPSLYTHAVGWAIDPKLREKAHWKNWKLLGKRLDQYLMNMDGKLSQGIPIGTDVSYLLAECVLSRVDSSLPIAKERGYRWFDDYEIAFETRDEAESCMKFLGRELARFRLRVNPIKSRIISLPSPADEEWQQLLVQTGGKSHIDSRGMVKHFDSAFRLREQYPDSPVLLYALGVLFGISCPNPKVGRIAQSCMSQALLSEPGAAQKAFALLSYWRTNGFPVDAKLVTQTVNRLILRHEAGGVSSDVSWALSFCIDQNVTLDSKSAKVLSDAEDDCIALQALHMWSIGLLPKGFSKVQIAKLIKNADLDREHWLICYESLRQHFLTEARSMVAANPLFSDLLRKDVTFYRTGLPGYASVIHHGGAPDWLLRRWIEQIKIGPNLSGERETVAGIPKAIEDDLLLLQINPLGGDDPLENFLSLLDAEPEDFRDVTYPE
jgi:hypothetical protein